MKTSYTATAARAKLFDILNAVYYRDETIQITKNNKVVAELSRPATTHAKKSLLDFAGTLSRDEAASIKKVIRSLKKLPSRASHE